MKIMIDKLFYEQVYKPAFQDCKNTGEIMDRVGWLGQWIMALPIKPNALDVYDFDFNAP